MSVGITDMGSLIARALPEPRTDEYWEWFSVALFLLVPVDLLLTWAAMSAVGIMAEANPIMRWLLTQPISLVVFVHLAVVVFAASCFAGILLAMGRTPSPYDRMMALGIELWLAGLIASGLFVYANNLMVIVHGVSMV